MICLLRPGLVEFLEPDDDKDDTEGQGEAEKDDTAGQNGRVCVHLQHQVSHHERGEEETVIQCAVNEKMIEFPII